MPSPPFLDSLAQNGVGLLYELPVVGDFPLSRCELFLEREDFGILLLKPELFTALR
jgi:hypothetical protein